MISAHFHHIRHTLIDQLVKASTQIDVAVAWFTQRDLFNTLISALDRGVTVSVLLSDSIINTAEHGLDFNLFIKKGGRIKFANSLKAFMHNKFCIIDHRILITGSYNWTYYAEKRNYENILITDDIHVCSQYTDYFIEQWNSETSVTDSKHVCLNDYDDSKFISEYPELHNEYVAMLADNVITQEQFNNLVGCRNSVVITKLGTLRTCTNRNNPILKHNIGMECRINGVDGKVLCIIPKGQSLPYTNVVDTVTCDDFQTSIIFSIVYGDDDYAYLNQSFVQIPLSDLPQLPAGQVKFKTKVTLDTNGYMHIECVCVNNGNSNETEYREPEIIDYNSVQ